MMVAGDAAIMSDSAHEIIKAHCPNCGPERNAYLRAKHVGHWSEKDSPRMVKKLEWIEMAQLAVSSILFKSLSLKLP
jgi:hypothetical protein